jgi:copper chaperone
MTQIWTVSGMTCEHCVASVSKEVSALAGVTSVEVTLETGELVVAADTILADDLVRSAVEEAGYTLA